MERCNSKTNQIGKLSYIEKLKLKNSRPKSDMAISQNWSSSSVKF